MLELLDRVVVDGTPSVERYPQNTVTNCFCPAFSMPHVRRLNERDVFTSQVGQGDVGSMWRRTFLLQDPRVALVWVTTHVRLSVERIVVVASFWVKPRRPWWLHCTRERRLRSTESRTCIVSRYPDPQHLWWQSVCSCRSWAMEQFTATSQRCWLTVQSVPAVTKDSFVWIVGPRRSANYFNCAV